MGKRVGIQLCEPATETNILSLGEEFIGQTKLNGLRCRVVWNQGVPVLLTSEANEFLFLDKIREQLESIKKMFPSLSVEQLRFDGELYIHGWPLSKIRSVARSLSKNQINANKHELDHLMEFHIFDLQMPELDQMNRLRILDSLILDEDDSLPNLKVVHSWLCKQDNWHHLLSHFESLAYEGIVMKHMQGKYVEKRTKQWLKMKPTEEDEYEIIGYREGRPGVTGWALGHLGSLQVRGDDGTEFWVGSGFDIPERKALWIARENLIGKTAKVKHEKIKTGKNKLPTNCIIVEVK